MFKSKFLIFLLSIITAFSSLTFSACVPSETEDAVYVVSIAQTSTDGNKTVYTVTYSNGTTTTFEVVNGVDGEKGEKGDKGNAGNNGTDGKDFNIKEVFEKYLELHPDASYEDFLQAFLTVNPDGNALTINKALLTSAKIYTEFVKKKDGITDTAISSGSAVIYRIDQDYTYFITNFHVVYEPDAIVGYRYAKKITCYLYGSEGWPSKAMDKDDKVIKDNDGNTVYNYSGMPIECEYVGGAAMSDIAIVRVNTSVVLGINPEVKAVKFADGYHVGETAIAIGNPESEGISVSEGIVSVDNEKIKLNVDGTTREFRSIRIDTAIYHGSSGGGLYNAEGELIGITNAGDVTDQNINYAIPVQIVKGAVENIMYYSACGVNTVMKIKFGVTVTSKNSKYVYDKVSGYGKIIEDVTVLEVDANSISQKMGVIMNDVITAIKINGVEYKIDRYFEIGDLLYVIKAGDVIGFNVIRNGSAKTDLPTYTVLESDIKPAD